MVKRLFFSFIFLFVCFISGIHTCHSNENINSKLIHKFGFSLGISWQVYSGDYRNSIANKSYYLDYLLVKNKDTKYSNSFDFHGTYDLQFNISKLFKPFIGVGFDFSFPISKLNVFSVYYTSISNFVDLNLRIGGSFRFLDIFEISVYANGGFSSAIWLANGATVNFFEGIIISGRLIEGKEYIDQDMKFGYGYMFGGGIDLIIRDRYIFGIFYANHKMIGGQYSEDGTGKFDTARYVEHRGFVNKYQNHTIGVRIGLNLIF